MHSAHFPRTPLQFSLLGLHPKRSPETGHGEEMQALPSVSCVFATDVATAITAGSGAAARERGGHTGAHRCVLRAGGAQCLCGIGGGGGQHRQQNGREGTLGCWHQQNLGGIHLSAQQGVSKPLVSTPVLSTHQKAQSTYIASGDPLPMEN